MANGVKPPSPNRPRPVGRDAAHDAILDAAERLFAAAGPAGVSLRAIAAEAGVTYGLVHAYVGSKDELIERVLARYADRWTPQLDGLGFDGALHTLLAGGPAAGPYLQVLAWSLLRGSTDDVDVHRRHATLDRVPALRDGEDSADARLATATAIALIFGWRFFNPFLRDALHLDGTDDELQAAIGDAVQRLAAGPSPITT